MRRLAMNCAAPDEGNMHLLSVVASPEQKERYLRPLVAGRTRSCFAVTEPPPGAGSDPAALSSTATRRSGGWVLNGSKHFITGADGAGFAIVMARSTGQGAPDGATMFLVDADNPGWRVGERMRTIDSSTVGGHCRVELHLYLSAQGLAAADGRHLRLLPEGAGRRRFRAAAVRPPAGG
jgi:acyl-CoA dehydrogenase